MGHWVIHMDDESGVGHVVCTKRQLFGKTNNNTNYLSAVKYELSSLWVLGTVGEPININLMACQWYYAVIEKGCCVVVKTY